MDPNRRPPTFDEALDLYRQGHAALAEAEKQHTLGQGRQEALVKAAALFSASQAAAALRLITPHHLTVTPGEAR
jgi:hypothetical protein